jgi:hypothetical protein
MLHIKYTITILYYDNKPFKFATLTTNLHNTVKP